MSAIQRSVTRVCRVCKHKTTFMPAIGYVPNVGWRICLECSECHILVPDYGFDEWVRTGGYHSRPKAK